MERFKDEHEIGKTAEAAKIAQQIIADISRNKATLLDAVGAIVIAVESLGVKAEEDKFSDKGTVIASVIRSLSRNLRNEQEEKFCDELEITDEYLEDAFKRCLDIAELISEINSAYTKTVYEKWLALIICCDINIRAYANLQKIEVSRAYKEFMTIWVGAKESISKIL